MIMLDEIMDNYPDEEFMCANGFDDAIIGFEGDSLRLAYSVQKCIDILVDNGLSYEEALEFFEFNVRSAFVGEKTPIWIDTPIIVEE